MGEPTVLIWILVAFAAILLAALFLLTYRLRGISRELSRLNKTLDGLDGRIAEQERQLAEVRAALDQRGPDVFAPFIEALKSFKSKGLLAALTVVGSHFFRSYLGKRRQKSLPSPKDP